MAPASLNLSFVGLIFIARLLPLNETAIRAMLHGPPSLLEAFIIYPSMQTPITPSTIGSSRKINGAYLVSGQPLSICNQALSIFLEIKCQQGCLTTFHIGDPSSTTSKSSIRAIVDLLCLVLPLLSMIGFMAVQGPRWTEGDMWFLSVSSLLFLSKFISIRMLQAQVRPTASSVTQKGEDQEDLILHIGEECWARVNGATDMFVSHGSDSWLREPSALESCLMFLSTLLVYFAAVMAANVSMEGQLTMLFVVPIQEVLLWSSNRLTSGLHIGGMILHRSSHPAPFASSRLMARSLVEEYGTDRWLEVFPP